MAQRWRTSTRALLLILIGASTAQADPPDPIFANGFEAAATSFRFDTLSLRDPHVFVHVIGCNDLTDANFTGFSINEKLQTNLQTDADNDGFLDASYLQRLRPLDQSNGAIAEADFIGAKCAAPYPTSTCSADGSLPLMSVAVTQTSGTCLAPIAQTTHGYSPAIISSTAPCFATVAATTTLNLAGIPITLHNARIAATYVGTPATTLSNGLLTGFISEPDADATILPATIPLVSGQTLSSLLAGGTGACPAYSDKDNIDGVIGWQFYLNFTATKVDYSE